MEIKAMKKAKAPACNPLVGRFSDKDCQIVAKTNDSGLFAIV
jgi:hypothetical protein